MDCLREELAPSRKVIKMRNVIQEMCQVRATKARKAKIFVIVINLIAVGIKEILVMMSRKTVRVLKIMLPVKMIHYGRLAVMERE